MDEADPSDWRRGAYLWGSGRPVQGGELYVSAWDGEAEEIVSGQIRFYLLSCIMHLLFYSR